MKLKTNFLICCLLISGFYSIGQINLYNYKCEILGITNPWHKIILPDDIFSKISDNFSDLRIYGISPEKDTIEAPYLLRLTTNKTTTKEISFKTINPSHNNNGYFFTFEIPSKEPVNQIKLEFSQTNFDWRIKLEGSQNQQEWFTIIDDYRILSIKNDQTDFQSTNINFPNSAYRYFRVNIISHEKPDLLEAKISDTEITQGIFNNYNISNVTTTERTTNNQTVIDIELPKRIPICYLKINVKDSFDYYRPMTIEYLTDSFKTEKGWKYNYSTLYSGTLNSIQKNDFYFASTILKKMRIIVDNYDNQLLTINSFEIKGYTHELLVRFTQTATYFLTYGNKYATEPQYDIERFSENIPDSLTALELGPEQIIAKDEKLIHDPLFENKTWLWVAMTVIIILLSWFSIRMMKKK